MAITYFGAGPIAADGADTGVVIEKPPGVQAGDCLIMFVGTRGDTNAADVGNPGETPGWTRLGDLKPAPFTQGADAGPMRITAYWRRALGDGEPTTVPVASNAVSWFQILGFRSPTQEWDVAAVFGQDTTTGTAWSATMGANPGIAADDFCVVGSALPTDTATFSNEAVTVSGLTMGTAVKASEPQSAISGDIGGFIFYQPVGSGTATGNATVTATVGGSTSTVRGPSALVRIRQVGGAPVPIIAGSVSARVSAAARVGASTGTSRATVAQAAARITAVARTGSAAGRVAASAARTAAQSVVTVGPAVTRVTAGGPLPAVSILAASGAATALSQAAAGSTRAAVTGRASVGPAATRVAASSTARVSAPTVTGVGSVSVALGAAARASTTARVLGVTPGGRGNSVQPVGARAWAAAGMVRAESTAQARVAVSLTAGAAGDIPRRKASAQVAVTGTAGVARGSVRTQAAALVLAGTRTTAAAPRVPSMALAAVVAPPQALAASPVGSGAGGISASVGTTALGFGSPTAASRVPVSVSAIAGAAAMATGALQLADGTRVAVYLMQDGILVSASPYL